MPSTLLGLIVFVSLLTPGFAYLARLESRAPGQAYSPLRETALVVTVSVVSNALVLMAFGLVRSLWPGVTPDAGELVRESGRYARSNYVSLVGWGAALLLLSSALAAAAAVPPRWLGRIAGRVPGGPGHWVAAGVERAERRRIVPESAWGTAFHRHPDRRVFLGVRMVDGTYMYGPLASFNPQVEERNDRALTLGAPIQIRTPSMDEPEPMDADSVIIAAAQIKTLAVHYLPAEDDDDS